MPTRDHAPAGAPCWTDLWTSDVEASRHFYSELFGWEALEPNEEFGGYFMFARDGVPVAGGMGSMGDMEANDTWKIYLATPDMERTARVAAEAGGDVSLPPMPVADLGIQLVMADPVGAVVGAWQEGTFPGFTVLGEHGSPSWFELHTRDHPRTLAFYREVFDWDVTFESDTDEFRYATVHAPKGGDWVAGVMDGAAFMPEENPAEWAVYWEVDDVDATLAKVKELGGMPGRGPEDTPYGRLVECTDSTGAIFKLRRSPR